jgi:hypothetical protein
VSDWPGLGAANNARWCDLITRSHGGHGDFADDAWTSPARTPALYPDAVTLVPSLEVRDLLARIDATSGCTIKDSFATLDLASFGFRVLFDAEWMSAPPPRNGSSDQWGWIQITDPDGLRQWEEAWAGDTGGRGLFLPDLLLDESVRFLASLRGDRIVAGAILHRDSGVIGVTNVFTTVGSPSDTWSGLVEYANAHFPAEALVGYESGPELAHARQAGFHGVGPLRVWMADG